MEGFSRIPFFGQPAVSSVGFWLGLLGPNHTSLDRHKIWNAAGRYALPTVDQLRHQHRRVEWNIFVPPAAASAD